MTGYQPRFALARVALSIFNVGKLINPIAVAGKVDQYVEAFLLVHKKTKGGEKARLLSEYSPDKVTIREAQLSGFNTGNIPTGKTYERICAAAKAFFAERHGDPEAAIKLLKPNYSVHSKIAMEYEKIHSSLEGPWLLVHLSSIHFEPSNIEPQVRYRVAIIVYEKSTSGDRLAIDFRLFGRNTVFQGKARQIINKIYLNAQEVRRKEEELSLILNRPASRENILTHAGIITGVGFGEFNPEGNIYASKCLARKITLGSKEEGALLNEIADDDLRKSICAYYNEDQVSSQSIESSCVKDEIMDTIKSFRSRFSENAIRLYL